MIFPNKYINYENSYIGIAEEILKVLSNIKNKKITIEKLWNKFSKEHDNVTFLKFYYALILLLTIGLINKKDGSDYLEFKICKG